MLKKPNALLLAKRNMTRPFEDSTSIEFLSKINDASLFMFGCHSKKRPHNIIIGKKLIKNYHMRWKILYTF